MGYIPLLQFSYATCILPMHMVVVSLHPISCIFLITYAQLPPNPHCFLLLLWHDCYDWSMFSFLMATLLHKTWWLLHVWYTHLFKLACNPSLHGGHPLLFVPGQTPLCISMACASLPVLPHWFPFHLSMWYEENFFWSPMAPFPSVMIVVWVSISILCSLLWLMVISFLG